jgi:hypothetical protein
MKAQREGHLVTFALLQVNYLMNRVSVRCTASIKRLQALVQTHLIMAAECISKLAQLRPPSVSPIPDDYGLEVHTITIVKCISKLAQLRPPSSHNYGLPGASSNSLDYVLGVYHQNRSDTACQFVRSWPPTASPTSHDYGSGLNLYVHLITASKSMSNLARLWPPRSHDYGLQVHLQTHLIMASMYISNLTQSHPPSLSPNSLHHTFQVNLQTCSIIAPKCISKSARLPPLNASPNLLDHDLGVYHSVQSIVIFRRTSESSQALLAARPNILCVDGLLYTYIDENTNWIHQFWKSSNDKCMSSPLPAAPR